MHRSSPRDNRYFKMYAPRKHAASGGFLCPKFCPDYSVLMELSKKNQPDPDADYHDEDALELPEDDGDEDEEVDVNEDYEAESDDEPV